MYITSDWKKEGEEKLLAKDKADALMRGGLVFHV
jgi:hypothetical protein